MNNFELGHELLRGMLLGLAIAAPVGPIAILCIKRTLTQGWRVGVATGLGAATADGIYGCVAGLGLTAIAGFLVAQQTWLKLCGGLFLIYLGIQTCRSEAVEPDRTSTPPARNFAMAYGSTLGLTLTNPVTILSFVAILSGFGIVETAQLQAISLITGIFCGSTLWWLFLSGLTYGLGRRLSARFLRRMNRASGLVLTIFGGLALLSSLSSR